VNTCREFAWTRPHTRAMTSPRSKSFRPRPPSSPSRPRALTLTYEEQLAELGLVSAESANLVVDLSQPAKCDADGYVVGAGISRPAYDAIVSKIVEKNISPWDPPGGPYAIGIVATDGKTIYRVVRVSGIGELVGHVEPLRAAGFDNILASLQHRRWDAILVPTPKLLAGEAQEVVGLDSNAGAATLRSRATQAPPLPNIHEDLATAAAQLEALSQTEREQVVLARLGQGRFRADLMTAFGGCCGFTELDFDPVLRASHIKPWRDSTNVERLDADNGLLLRADVDALFDSGHITFGDDGELLLAAAVPKSSVQALAAIGVHEQRRLSESALTPGRRIFLAYHRATVFRG